MTDDTSERIVEAAMEEFSESGFGGARVARIAEKAGVNKALLFYYYRSKAKLYGAVMESVMNRILGPLLDFLETVDSAEEFLKVFPALHIRFIAQNQKLMRIAIGHFIGRPSGINEETARILVSKIVRIRDPFFRKVDRWIKEGQIKADDPVQFIINVISLNIFCFLVRPFFEAISGFNYDADPEFVEKRIRSVISTLQGGMLS